MKKIIEAIVMLIVVAILGLLAIPCFADDATEIAVAKAQCSEFRGKKNAVCQDCVRNIALGNAKDCATSCTTQSCINACAAAFEADAKSCKELTRSGEIH